MQVASTGLVSTRQATVASSFHVSAPRGFPLAYFWYDSQSVFISTPLAKIWLKLLLYMRLRLACYVDVAYEMSEHQRQWWPIVEGCTCWFSLGLDAHQSKPTNCNNRKQDKYFYVHILIVTSSSVVKLVVGLHLSLRLGGAFWQRWIPVQDSYWSREG